MLEDFYAQSEMRRIFIYLGAAGIVALVGGGIYAAAISAVTPTHAPVTPAVQRPGTVTSPVATSAEQQAPQGHTISLKGETIRVDIADTPAERERGLSGRSGLGKNEGLLFVFPEEGQYGFWMKDMLFPIDIIWIANDGTIVYVVESATPESYPNAYLPPRAARYVLELPADWIRTHRVSTGEKVDL